MRYLNNHSKQYTFSKYILFILFLFILLTNQAFTQSEGDYRSVASGNWSSLTTWERYDGTSWATPTTTEGYPAQYAGTGQVVIRNAHDVILDVSPPEYFGGLIVTGTSTDRSSLRIALSQTLNTWFVLLTAWGEMWWTANNVDLYFPENTVFIVDFPGMLNVENPCNNTKALWLGATRYAACTGGGNVVYTFADLNAAGGALWVNIESSSTDTCYTGSEIRFTLSATSGGLGYMSTNTTYTWSLTSGPSGYSFTDIEQTYSTLSSINLDLTISGTYVYRITARHYIPDGMGNLILYYVTYDEVTIYVYPLPQGNLSGNTVCEDGTPQLTFTSSENNSSGPYVLIINAIAYTEIISGVPFSPSPVPTISTIYTLTSITDAHTCVRTSGFSDDTALVTINHLPQGSLEGSSVCSGGIGYLTWNSTQGEEPFTIVYNNGTINVTQTNILSGEPFPVNSNQTEDSTYIIISVSDFNGCIRTTGFTEDTASINVLANGLWLGAVSSDWFDIDNWCGGIPTYETDVVIQEPSPYYPHIGDNGAECRNLNLGTGASLDFDGAYNLDIYGNWVNNGTFTASTGTVSFIGPSEQSISGANITFYNIILDNEFGLTLTDVDATATNNLTFVSGKITTNSNKIIVGSPGELGTITGASTDNYINGILRRYITSIGSIAVEFPIGDESNYTPVSMVFNGEVTGNGYLDVFTTVLTEPPPEGSGISQFKYISRSWSIDSQELPGFSSCDITFNFVDGDKVGSPNPMYFIIRRNIGTNWFATNIGTKTLNSTQFTGATEFGIYYIGEYSRTCILPNHSVNPYQLTD